jgi:hypothetical protein
MSILQYAVIYCACVRVFAFVSECVGVGVRVRALNAYLMFSIFL